MRLDVDDLNFIQIINVDRETEFRRKINQARGRLMAAEREVAELPLLVEHPGAAGLRALYERDPAWQQLAIRAAKDQRLMNHALQLLERISNNLRFYLSHYGRVQQGTEEFEITECDYLRDRQLAKELRRLVPAIIDQFRTSYIELNNYYMIKTQSILPENISELAGLFATPGPEARRRRR